MMKIVPNAGRVFVELDPIGEMVTKGGIIIPGVHSEMSRVGRVKEVAPDVTLFAVGDRIFINWFSGTGVDFIDSGFRHDTHRFLNQVEILGKVFEE
jgi:co-chaperonin GroES (HSP10)